MPRPRWLLDLSNHTQTQAGNTRVDFSNPPLGRERDGYVPSLEGVAAAYLTALEGIREARLRGERRLVEG